MARTLAPTRHSGAAFIASGPSMRLPSDADSVTGKRLLLPGSGCCAESSRRRWHAPRQARAVRLVRFDRSGSDMRPPLGPTVCYRCTRLVVRIAQRMRPASSTQERQQGRTHRCRIAARRTLPRESRDLKGQSMARRRERRRPARRPSRGAGRRRRRPGTSAKSGSRKATTRPAAKSGSRTAAASPTAGAAVSDIPLKCWSGWAVILRSRCVCGVFAVCAFLASAGWAAGRRAAASIASRLRDGLRWARRVVMDHHWHQRPVIGRPLRWLGRYLP